MDDDDVRRLTSVCHRCIKCQCTGRLFCRHPSSALALILPSIQRLLNATDSVNLFIGTNSAVHKLRKHILRTHTRQDELAWISETLHSVVVLSCANRSLAMQLPRLPAVFGDPLDYCRFRTYRLRGWPPSIPVGSRALCELCCAQLFSTGTMLSFDLLCAHNSYSFRFSSADVLLSRHRVVHKLAFFVVVMLLFRGRKVQEKWIIFHKWMLETFCHAKR